MLTFLFYWLIHQYVLYCLHTQFVPPSPIIPSDTVVEVMAGSYRCPNDYLLFPDEEALLIHWQIEHPFVYKAYQQTEESVREAWLASLKVQP